MAYETDGQSAITGTDGQVTVGGTRIARLTSWGYEESAGESAWGDSDSAGYTFRKAGRKDAKGSIGGKFDKTNPPYVLFRAGDSVALVLSVQKTPHLYYAIPAAEISNFKFDVNQDTKEVIGWTADWGADGKYYRPAEAGAPAASYPT